MELKIYNNFLDERSFSTIEEQILNPNFPWSWGGGVIPLTPIEGAQPEGAGGLDDYQFFHTIYDQYQIKSQFFQCLHPLFHKLNVVSLLRIKANLNPRTHEIVEHGFHTDFPTDSDFKFTTGILYINDNNGYTIFDDGQKVESVRNRYVEFASDRIHSGSSCTNQKRRLVINFNYLKGKPKNDY